MVHYEMTGHDRWLTNLESDAKVAEALNAANEALAAAEKGNDPRAVSIAMATKVHAELLAEGHRRTMALLANEYPGYEIAEPRATRMKTAAAIKADGIVGIYRAKGA